MTDPLDRIAAALERLSPPPPAAADPLAHPAYLWRGRALEPARAFRPLSLDALHGIDRQKAALLANVHRLAAGHAAHDVLLWGARGTGKSASVTSAVAAVQAGYGQTGGGDLALVEVVTARLDTLPALFAVLAGVRRAFAVFVDDLGLESAADGRALRSMLEGGAEARPANARLFVTSNRRHVVARDMAGQAGAGTEGAINPRDTADDELALADRFGLSLGFHAVDQADYLAIVRGYADARGLLLDEADALGWATRRGGRSGRVAWQYVVELAGRAGLEV
ncbi:DUF815 domain-containing protein [uncultured Sphingomonas sp.]|uniref:DUF815 domain-containing protein n=1 Tax=uncultured Sphingomonas sp. TaxID=158754 RepID=UPI0035CA6F38